MKQDIIFYLALPILILSSTTIISSILALLKVLQISADTSELWQDSPVINCTCLMLILYYFAVTLIIKDSLEITSSQLERISISSQKISNTIYGQTTDEELEKLMNDSKFKQIILMGNEDSRSLDRDNEMADSEKKKLKNVVIRNDNSDEDSDHDNFLTCHQVATARKMF